MVSRRNTACAKKASHNFRASIKKTSNARPKVHGGITQTQSRGKLRRTTRTSAGAFTRYSKRTVFFIITFFYGRFNITLFGVRQVIRLNIATISIMVGHDAAATGFRLRCIRRECALQSIPTLLNKTRRCRPRIRSLLALRILLGWYSISPKQLVTSALAQACAGHVIGD